MAEALKNIYNEAFFSKLTTALTQEYPEFNAKSFLKLIYDDMWNSRELKQRMRHITTSLHQMMPSDYREAISVLRKAAIQMQGYGLECLVFPDYVEVYGLDMENWAASISALELFTQYSTSEFAVRPFIIQYPGPMMAQMLQWAEHENHHVRRLASEGCRPRLPWACALPLFKKDPSPILPILDILKADSSEYVRKSAANNLNDIAKDHPELVLGIAGSWYGRDSRTDWILKHGCRTLLKKGNPQALALFGFEGGAGAGVNGISLSDQLISIGESLTFSFTLSVENQTPNKLRVEYGIYFVKSGGKVSRKIFKITENIYTHNKPVIFTKKHSFKDLSTRKHYPGEHKLSIIINGKEESKISFSLM